MRVSSSLARFADRSLKELFDTIDAKDVDGFVAYLSPDARLRFGSAPALEGVPAIRGAIGGFFATINGLRHDIDNVVEADGRLYCEGFVTYTRLDGSRVTLPFVDVLVRATGAAGSFIFSDYRIYIDIAPLYAEPG